MPADPGSHPAVALQPKDYFQEHKDEIIAQRRNRRQELRDQERTREQVEREKKPPCPREDQ